MTKSTENKTKKKSTTKIEDVEAQIAFAEAGELYSHKKKGKPGDEKAVCVDGETSSGLCTECGQ